jgi:hypothetical protein
VTAKGDCRGLSDRYSDFMQRTLGKAEDFRTDAWAGKHCRTNALTAKDYSTDVRTVLNAEYCRADAKTAEGKLSDSG